MKNKCYRKTYHSDSYPTFKWCKQKGKISKLKLLETESLENGYFSVKSLEKNFKFGKIKGGEGGEGEKEKLNAIKKKIWRNNTLYKKTFFFTQTAKHSWPQQWTL